MSKLTEYIKELKNNVAQKGNLSEIEIIRYVYINLGKKMDFDLNYTFGNKKEKEKIFQKVIDDEELEKVFEAHTAICKSLSYLLEKILKEFNIDARTIRENNYYNSRRII